MSERSILAVLTAAFLCLTGSLMADDALYKSCPLTTDTTQLSDTQQAVLSELIDAAAVMDDLFWKQSYGERGQLPDLNNDPVTKSFVDINYGPWDRLNDEKPFVAGVSKKPLGARFYPEDMTKEEFEAWGEPKKTDGYSLVTRGADGKLEIKPYTEVYRSELEEAAKHLRKASEISDNAGLKHYLSLRADALLSNDYRASDLAWLDMKDNQIDVIIGPIESYEDMLYGYRNAYEGMVLVKDMAWSAKLSRFAALLPELQRGLPVAELYKKETPGSDSDLNAYDLVFCSGHGNAGPKAIAVNLPNDEQVQLQKGTRRLQLKNAMKAKFDNMMTRIADELITPAQRANVTFDAFFENTMFHEVAHGLGVKNTVNNRGPVRKALAELASALEEGKADILGLYMVERLRDLGELTDGQLLDNYVTFLAGIFRSVRFGASSAHGMANMVRFNYFAERGAFTRLADGRYSVNPKSMSTAIKALTHDIITLQGDGDYAGVRQLFERLGKIGPELAKDLDKIKNAGIPVDITFEQGKKLLGLI